MGRQVFRVPPDWEHPRKEDGSYQSMHMDRSYREEAADWLNDAMLWSKGEHPDQHDKSWDVSKYRHYWEWSGDPPDPKYYRQREWTDEEATHWQMYETTSEGSPISPVMKSPEALARWLADNKASAFASMTATYEQWLHMITGMGWAPSMVVSVPGGAQSGVAFAATVDGNDEPTAA